MTLSEPRPPLRFTANLLTRPPLRGVDVLTTLRHFAIVTYAVEPARLRPHLHPRFEPELIELEGKGAQALLSVVPFFDTDFRFAGFPFVRWSFGQTNYRAYVRDTLTGELAVWFFGTTLDSVTVAIPRHGWQLPWHRGRIRFDTAWDEHARRYRRYHMVTTSDWAPVELELADTGRAVSDCPGFPDLESGLVVLTHPLAGYFYRRDGRLGSYRIWHERLTMSEALLRHARFALLERLDLVPRAAQEAPHSVWVQREVEFAIYLPPRPVPD